MIDILLQNGDLVVDKYGDIMLCADESEDVIQTANNNILTRFKGNKFHMELGNKIYNKRIKANQSGIELVQAECTDAILNDPRVREIKRVNVTLMEDASCMIDYILTYAKTKENISAEDELVEVNSKTYIYVFNMKGGE